MKNYKKYFYFSIFIFIFGFIFCGIKLSYAQIESIPKISTDYLFNFAVYGDSRTGYENHQAIVSQIEKLNPDFILHTGDFVLSGDLQDDWNKFSEITNNLRSRPKKTGLAKNFYPAIGNHDFPLNSYFSIFGLDPYSDYYYSFDYKKFHFISLDTEENFQIGSEQYNWLVADLEKTKKAKKEIIVFLHKSIYSSGHYGLNLEIREVLVPLFEEYKVKMVFSGHEHIYERSFPILGEAVNNTEGIIYVIAGGGGAPLYPTITFNNWWTANVQSIYHFVFLQVTNSKISGWTVDSNGNIIDNFEIKNYKTKKNIISSAGPGGGAHIRKFLTSGKLKDSGFFAFQKEFSGGARIASGDIDLDGKDEIIVGAGPGGSPQIRIFETDGKLKNQFFAFEKSYKGGVDVAVGDADGDGKDDIAVSKLSGNHAEIKVFRYNNKRTVLLERNAFPKSKIGAAIALGDIDGDKKAELIAGSGIGKKTEIRIFDIEEGNYEGELSEIKYFPFGKKAKMGLDVTAGDVDGDGVAEIIVSKMSSKADVKVFKYNSQKTLVGKFRAFSKKYKHGANIETFNVDSDGKEEILVGAGEGKLSKPQIKIFDYTGKLLNKTFSAYNKNFKGGVRAVGVNE